MTISYNENIPATGNRPSADQPIMQTNAVAIKQILGIDHVSFEDNTAPNGYHNVIHFKNQVTDPGVVAGVGQLYTKTVSGDQYLFYETGIGTVYQVVGNSSSLSTNGYTTLPNGLIFQWGTKTSTGGLQTVNLPTSFPNNFFMSQATMIRNSSNVDSVYAVTNATAGVVASIQFRDTSSGNNFFWFAIGN